MEKKQTALQQSIQRKKDRIEWFNTRRASDNSLYRTQEDELRIQISEDEKLLEVEREQLIEARSETGEWKLNDLGKHVKIDFDAWFTQTYTND